jgi:hypothetical protein
MKHLEDHHQDASVQEQVDQMDLLSRRSAGGEMMFEIGSV